MDKDNILTEQTNPDIQKYSGNITNSQHIKKRSVLYAVLGIVIGLYIALLFSVIITKLMYTQKPNDVLDFTGFGQFLLLTGALILICSFLCSVSLVILHKYIIELFGRLNVQHQTNRILYKLLSMSNWMAGILLLILVATPITFILLYGW